MRQFLKKKNTSTTTGGYDLGLAVSFTLIRLERLRFFHVVLLFAQLYSLKEKNHLNVLGVCRNFQIFLEKEPSLQSSLQQFSFLPPQLGPKINVELSLIESKWKELSLPIEQFQEICRVGNFMGEIEWIFFHAICCSQLSKVREKTEKCHNAPSCEHRR